MIHVCYELTDSTGHYSKFVGTSMLSMFENTESEITVHILHDNTLTADNREKIISIAEKYNQSVKFYNVEELFPELTEKYKNFYSEKAIKIFTLATAYLIFIYRIISKDISKAVNLDADTVVNLDIKEIFDFELHEKPLAAVLEHQNSEITFKYIELCKDGIVKAENYFNTGILLLNLDYLRNINQIEFEKSVEYILTHPKYGRLPDQNVLNYCFSEKYLKLPEKFNCWIREQPRFENTPIERKIYHYISRGDSLNLDMRDKFNRLYWEYFMKTPWYNIEIFGNISDGLNEWYNERQKFVIKITAALAGKERAFFTEHCNIEPVKKTFLIKDGEEIFATAANEEFEDSIINKSDSVIKLLEIMKKTAGKKFYFLLIGGHYKNLRPILEAEGFVENEDFTDGQLFRSQSSGEPLDTYPIIKAM